MEKDKWDLKEVKRLKWRQLIQYNVVMLLLFLVAIYAVKSTSSAYFIFIFFTVIVWIVSIHALYTLKTGKILGTKTMKIVHQYDKDFQGKKRWKRKKILEAVFAMIVAIGCTVLVSRLDLRDVTVNYYNLAPFIGAWVGLNIGEVFRITNL